MWSPAAASVIARLVLREGFSDVSFRFGGLRTLPWYALGLGVPLAVGIFAYGAAWLTGLVGFQGGAGAFLIGLVAATTIVALQGCLFTAGEEIGWRGYMLTRLIDAGVPRPVLVSGLIWALWHLPLIFAGIYAAGPYPALSVALFVGSVTSVAFVFARMRLETGSIWPVIFAHSAWNSIIQGPFDGATKGPDAAALWTGESGILTVVVLVVVAVIVSRSEEHTSELQSRQYLVCRLLLEKKKINRIYSQYSLSSFPTNLGYVLSTTIMIQHFTTTLTC